MVPVLRAIPFGFLVAQAQQDSIGGRACTVTACTSWVSKPEALKNPQVVFGTTGSSHNALPITKRGFVILMWGFIVQALDVSCTSWAAFWTLFGEPLYPAAHRVEPNCCFVYRLVATTQPRPMPGATCKGGGKCVGAIGNHGVGLPCEPNW